MHAAGPGPGPKSVLRRAYAGQLIDVSAAFAQERFGRVGIHEFGYRVHVAFAMLFCFLLAFPMSVVELAGIPLWIIWAIRTWMVWRVSLLSFVEPMYVAIGAWAAWQFASLGWSGDPALGFDQLGALRWVWTFFVLYPVLDQRRALIISMACGFLFANGVQALHAIGAQVGWEAVTFGRMPDRISGWWQPVVAGSLLTGALGLHLPAAIMGRGRVQILACLGAGVTLLGVFATGSRGAWLASAALMAISLGIGVATIRPSSRRWRVVIVGGVIALAVAGVAWLVVGDSIARRAALAREEIAGAIEHKQFTSDTGARLLMWWWALEAMGEHPVIGVGAGGYRAWVESHLAEQGIDPADRATHDHAHSTPLQIGATTGLVGLGIGAILLAVAMRGALTGLTRDTLGSYDAGPAFAIVGLMLAGLFDPVHINAQTSAFLFTFFAICQYPRPAQVGPKGGA